MTTGRQIVTKALQKSGVLTKNEAPAADEANDAIDALNAMLSSWANESLLCYAQVLESFTLSPGTATYTIGSGQTFATARPMQIISANIRSAGLDYPLSVISSEAYESKTHNKASLGRPDYIAIDNAFPAATIKLFPTPSQADTLRILSEKALAEIALNTEISLPPGWERALIYNLANETASDYDQPVPPKVEQIATESKGAIKRSTARNRSMDAYPIRTGINNIYTGYSN